jgi:hypothetical protein
MFGRKASFWVTAGGAAILAIAVVQFAADRVPNDGLKRFRSFLFKDGAS